MRAGTGAWTMIAQLDVWNKVRTMSKVMDKVTMRTRRVGHTWQGSLDDDVHHSFGWFLVEVVRELSCCLAFRPVFVRRNVVNLG